MDNDIFESGDCRHSQAVIQVYDHSVHLMVDGYEDVVKSCYYMELPFPWIDFLTVYAKDEFCLEVDDVDVEPMSNQAFVNIYKMYKFGYILKNYVKDVRKVDQNK